MGRIVPTPSSEVPEQSNVEPLCFPVTKARLLQPVQQENRPGPPPLRLQRDQCRDSPSVLSCEAS